MINSIKKKIKKVNQLLIKRYGIPLRPGIPPDPVDMLIATILSQNTNDRNSYKAFLNLKDKYKTWDEVAKLPASKIESIIKIAGLGKQKSAAIKNFLTSVLKEKGSITLNYLQDMNDDEVLAKLTGFGGVGVKTASCVLQFAMRRNVCPVDTHVHRTVNRIGIVQGSTPDKTFLKLKAEMPEDVAHSFHTNLIRLGREICRPTTPLCFVCPLLKVCEYDDKNLDKSAVYKENKFMLLDSIE
jgi:endonuclease III